ncbi:MAG: hypothetical protein M3R24_37935 [Chloroflexota bacterium]|nr:hypothetical protein [Chloroflexota bacterium]
MTTLPRPTSTSWTRIGVCPAAVLTDRLHHAGLSPDGRWCFLAGTYDEAYGVWDIRHHQLVWLEDGDQEVPEHPDLHAWVSAGYITLDALPVRSRFRVFGLAHNYPLVVNQSFGIRVEISGETVALVDGATQQVQQHLAYTSFSGDWVFASFSDNGAVLAVLEPYSVTFFGPES